MLHNKYFEIMHHFLKGYNKEIYGRELIKKVTISQKNIAITLDELEREAILTSTKKGNVKYYSLNKLNPIIKQYLLLFETEKTIEFLKKHPKISAIFERINSSDSIIIVFGSYAKGTEKGDSDLDFFIIGEVNEQEIKKIGMSFNMKISIKKGNKKDFIHLLKEKNLLINEILENHLILCGFEEFIDEIIKIKW